MIKLNYELIKERSMNLASSKRYIKRVEKVFNEYIKQISMFINSAANGYINDNAIDIVVKTEISRDLKNLKPFIYEAENLLLKDLADTYVFQGFTSILIKEQEKYEGKELEEDLQLFIEFYILEKVRELLHDKVEEKVKIIARS